MANRYLIVNADDFGYSQGINKGIIEAHTQGIVTSTSVMVDSIAAHEAIKLIDYPELSIGLHFVPSNSISIGKELNRQIDKFIEIIGAKPDHIDVHKRLNLTGTVEKVLQEYSKINKIPVRSLGYAKFIDSFYGPHAGGNLTVKQLRMAIDEATDEYNEIMCHVGYSDDYLREISSYNDPREQELSLICDPSVKEYIHQKGLILVNWQAIKI
jgi:predicted glycoside hydrolase/deacetylase ChbG (UPF0249 family)